MIRKIFCHYIRGSDLQYFYFPNIAFSNMVIDIITNYCEDFFMFHSNFKYSEILLSNNNKTATILMKQLIDREPDYTEIGDRFILLGIPIFPRKNYIYSVKLRIDKCSTQTMAISFLSDFYYFKLNHLSQKHKKTGDIKETIDREILSNLPIHTGTYTIWCNEKRQNPGIIKLRQRRDFETKK